MTTAVAHFNSRVRGRTTLAQTLRDPKYSDLLGMVGLRDTDLAEVQKQGELAEEYDRKQHDDLGAQRQTIASAARRRSRPRTSPGSKPKRSPRRSSVGTLADA